MRAGQSFITSSDLSFVASWGLTGDDRLKVESMDFEEFKGSKGVTSSAPKQKKTGGRPKVKGRHYQHCAKLRCWIDRHSIQYQGYWAFILLKILWNTNKYIVFRSNLIYLEILIEGTLCSALHILSKVWNKLISVWSDILYVGILIECLPCLHQRVLQGTLVSFKDGNKLGNLPRKRMQMILF